MGLETGGRENIFGKRPAEISDLQGNGVKREGVEGALGFWLGWLGSWRVMDSDREHGREQSGGEG